MTEIDPRLVERAATAIRSLRSLGDVEGWEPDDKMIAETVLESFAVRDEFRCIYQDDIGHPEEGEFGGNPLGGRIFKSAPELAAAMQADPRPWTHMQHRWVLDTDWTGISAQVNWEYKR